MSAADGAPGGVPGPAGGGDMGAPANGDRDSVDDVIERLLSVRGACVRFSKFVSFCRGRVWRASGM